LELNCTLAELLCGLNPAETGRIEMISQNFKDQQAGSGSNQRQSIVGRLFDLKPILLPRFQMDAVSCFASLGERRILSVNTKRSDSKSKDEVT
jgi:hypothetical protein